MKNLISRKQMEMYFSFLDYIEKHINDDGFLTDEWGEEMSKGELVTDFLSQNGIFLE